MQTTRTGKWVSWEEERPNLWGLNGKRFLLRLDFGPQARYYGHSNHSKENSEIIAVWDSINEEFFEIKTDKPVLEGEIVQWFKESQCENPNCNNPRNCTNCTYNKLAFIDYDAIIDYMENKINKTISRTGAIMLDFNNESFLTVKSDRPLNKSEMEDLYNIIRPNEEEGCEYVCGFETWFSDKIQRICIYLSEGIWQTKPIKLLRCSLANGHYIHKFE